MIVYVNSVQDAAALQQQQKQQQKQQQEHQYQMMQYTGERENDPDETITDPERTVLDFFNSDLNLEIARDGSAGLIICSVQDCVMCILFSFNAPTLLVRRQEGTLACQKVDVGLLRGRGRVIPLELCTSYSSSCHQHLRQP